MFCPFNAYKLLFINFILSFLWRQSHNTFTQADINSGLVRFSHNGSETTTASFDFTVSDGSATLASQAFDIIINPLNDPPVFSGDRTATVNEGSSYILTSADLNLTDVDNTNSELVYTANNTSSNITIQEWNGSTWVASDNGTVVQNKF